MIEFLKFGSEVVVLPVPAPYVHFQSRRRPFGHRYHGVVTAQRALTVHSLHHPVQADVHEEDPVRHVPRVGEPLTLKKTLVIIYFI